MGSNVLVSLLILLCYLFLLTLHSGHVWGILGQGLSAQSSGQSSDGRTVLKTFAQIDIQETGS